MQPVDWWYADLARQGIWQTKPLVEWIRLAIREPEAMIGVPLRVDGFIHEGVMVR